MNFRAVQQALPVVVFHSMLDGSPFPATGAPVVRAAIEHTIGLSVERQRQTVAGFTTQ